MTLSQNRDLKKNHLEINLNIPLILFKLFFFLIKLQAIISQYIRNKMYCEKPGKYQEQIK